jgi:NADH-quinone oxidoreductase subunit M
MITIALIFFPILAAASLLVFPKFLSKTLALTASLIQLIFTVVLIAQFNPWMDTQFVTNIPWIQQLGISFYVGIDGISALMLILTNGLMPLIILSTFKKEIKQAQLFYALMLFMQGAMVGVFVALDAFLYYVLWELALIPIYFIALIWGGENRVRVTFKFFLYTLAGSLFMLAAIIYLFYNNSDKSFAIDSLYTTVIPENAQTWVFWAFFLAYAIKIPIFPFHTWQPDTYTTSPNAGTMLLSGIMLKMGLYSLVRWLFPIVPAAVMDWTNVALVLSIIGIVYASWIALSQNDIKRLFAYSSIAHVGLIAAGLFTLSFGGLQGAMIQMLAHGINVIGLFFVAEIFSQRLQTNDLTKLGGIRQIAPVFASCYMVISFGAVALPLTSGFPGEFLLLKSLYEYNAWFAAFAGLTIIFGAVYMLRAYKFSMLGPDRTDGIAFPDLNLTEKFVLFPIVALIIFLGVYPQFVFNLTEFSVSKILDIVNMKSGLNF